MCSCLSSSFLRSDIERAVLGRCKGEGVRDTLYRRHRESKCLNARFKPCSAGTTMCLAPIVIGLGRLLFCLDSFPWSHKRVQQLDKEFTRARGNRFKDCVIFPPYLILSNPIPTHPFPYRALPHPMGSKDGGCLGGLYKLLFQCRFSVR